MNNFKKQVEDLTSSLLDENNEMLVWAEETDNEKLLSHTAELLVTAAMALRDISKLSETKMSFDLDVEAGSILPQDIDSIATLAQEYDNSDDKVLQKRATVLDQLLINFAQSGLRAQAESEDEAELARLREEYRRKALERSYKEPKEILDKEIQAAESAKKIQDQVKKYRPLESSLSTRYCPDHAGAPVRRIGDYTYQCSLDKKIYNWQEGFTTMKGNKVPGSDVSRQTQHLGDRALEQMSFSTRESQLETNR